MNSLTGLFLLILNAIQQTESITCYKCESYRDHRCLDPFDFRPHVLVNCDLEPHVRDRKPVFCEKTTDLIDGFYVTTRGCSTYQWEDVDPFIDHRNQPVRCIRRGLLERCMCQYDGCNTGAREKSSAFFVFATTLFIFLQNR